MDDTIFEELVLSCASMAEQSKGRLKDVIERVRISLEFNDLSADAFRAAYADSIRSILEKHGKVRPKVLLLSIPGGANMFELPVSKVRRALKRRLDDETIQQAPRPSRPSPVLSPRPPPSFALDVSCRSPLRVGGEDSIKAAEVLLSPEPKRQRC